LELLEEIEPAAVVKKKGVGKLLWLALEAAAAGGVAYYFLLPPPEEEPTGFPEPPGRSKNG